MDNYIKGIIDRIEDEKAIISLVDGQKINWSLEKIPADCVEGTAVKISISKDGELDEEDEKKIMARNILNEILDVDEK